MSLQDFLLLFGKNLLIWEEIKIKGHGKRYRDLFRGAR
jgi:hypothetical protein